MSYETKILVLTLAGSIVLAAVYLYIQDLLYIRATGRPASERERERIERRNQPLTRSRYIWWSILVGSAILFEGYLAVWSNDYNGWSRLIPNGWIVSGGVPFITCRSVESTKASK